MMARPSGPSPTDPPQQSEPSAFRGLPGLPLLCTERTPDPGPSAAWPQTANGSSLSRTGHDQRAAHGAEHVADRAATHFFMIANTHGILYTFPDRPAYPHGCAGPRRERAPWGQRITDIRSGRGAVTRHCVAAVSSARTRVARVTVTAPPSAVHHTTNAAARCPGFARRLRHSIRTAGRR